MIFNDIESEHYDSWLLGHKKLDTTAVYTRVALKTLREVESPLSLLTPPPPA